MRIKTKQSTDSADHVTEHHIMNVQSTFRLPDTVRQRNQHFFVHIVLAAYMCTASMTQKKIIYNVIVRCYVLSVGWQLR